MSAQLSFSEEEVWLKFEAWLNIEHKEEFSCEDFVKYGCHRLLKDPQHDTGALFFKKLMKGDIEKTGKIKGRYNRMVWKYRLTR